MRETYDDAAKLLERIEGSHEHVFLIVAGTPKGPLPKGLLRTLRIGYPCAMVQIEAWSECLGRDADVEDAVHAWVERHPLHPSQIRAVCREARLRSMLEHGSDAHLQDFVEAVILGQRRQVPVLLGSH